MVHFINPILNEHKINVIFTTRKLAFLVYNVLQNAHIQQQSLS